MSDRIPVRLTVPTVEGRRGDVVLVTPERLRQLGKYAHRVDTSGDDEGVPVWQEK